MCYRIGPIEIDPNVIKRLHNQLVSDLENSDDSASDEEEDAFNWEWEAVRHTQMIYIISYHKGRFSMNVHVFESLNESC
jgi:hypothetical protein